MNKPILVRMTTIPIALEKLLSGQLEFMNDHYRVIAIASEKENLEKMGQKRGLEVFFLSMTRKITPLQDFKALVNLYRYFRKTRPLIVHTHTPKAGIVGMMAAKLAGVPNRLHTVAGLPLLVETGNKRKLLDFVEKLTYACATKVYPNSKGLRDIILENRYCDARKLKVFGNGSSNGIDTGHFDPALFSGGDNQKLRQELGIKPSDFVFVFVGRIVKDKGINELIEAFRQLQGSDPKVKLLLVGDYESDLDPLSAETLDFIQSNPNIIFTGWKNDVRPYFAISDALVFPSYREGFPNVVMQAGAMDLPCIVTDINGCNEIIEEGVNGLIIPVQNAPALLQAMQKIHTNPGFSNMLKANARPLIVSHYDQKKLWQLILEEYRGLESGKNPA